MVTMIAWFPFQCNCAKLVCVWERGRLRFAVQAHHWLGSGGFCFVALWEPGTIIGGHPAWACLPVQARRDRRAPADQWGCSARLIRDWVCAVLCLALAKPCVVCASPFQSTLQYSFNFIASNANIFFLLDLEIGTSHLTQQLFFYSYLCQYLGGGQKHLFVLDKLIYLGMKGVYRVGL